MGVYIKGMEKPGRCDECPLQDYYECDAKLRDTYCPLVPVPPHGRLGDLDALLESKDILDDIGWPDAYLPYSTIEAAPTIIPGEEGKT